jgi:hypothetical protein
MVLLLVVVLVVLTVLLLSGTPGCGCRFTGRRI